MGQAEHSEPVPQAEGPDRRSLLEDAKYSSDRTPRVRVRLTVRPHNFAFAGHLWPMGTSEGVISESDLKRAEAMVESNKITDKKGNVIVPDVFAAAQLALEAKIEEYAIENYGLAKLQGAAREAALKDAEMSVSTSLDREFYEVSKRWPLPILKIEVLERNIPSVLVEEETILQAQSARVMEAVIEKQQRAGSNGNQNQQKR